MAIQEIHEEVFKFLLKKRETDPSLRYNLRFQNDEKMKKGYWFHCQTDQNVYISFWDTWTDVFPTINFIITKDKTCQLAIDERRNGGQVEIWEDLKTSLNLNQDSKSRFSKEYSINKPYLDFLNDFIDTERSFINSYLKFKKREADYPSFPEGKFLRNLSKVENFRKVFNPSIINVAIQDEFSNFLEQKLTVNCVQLENINAFKSVNISFDKQVTCFVGGNGSGKTTLLRGIALALVGSKGFTAESLNLLAIKEARKFVKYEREGSITVFYKFNGE